MASSAICQLLSSTSGKSFLRTCRWPLKHGLLTRCISSKINDTSFVSGSSGSQQVATTNELFALSAINASSESFRGDKSAALLLSKNLTLPKISDFTLEQALSQMTLSPLESRLNVDFILPHAESPFIEKAILDPSPFASLQHDCPTVTWHPSVIDPLRNPLPNRIQAPIREGNAREKRASNIIHKRRRKMNRHQYLKWKKRNKFKLRILKQKSRKKKRLLREQHLSKFRFTELKPGEGEEYLAKKREKQAIYLRYLGIKTDKDTESRERQDTEARARQTVIKIVPERILPPGASM